MSPKALPIPARTAAEIAELRNVIREGHELLRDLRNTIRDAKTFEVSLGKESVTERIEEVVSKGLEEYVEVEREAIKSAEKRINDRFDLLADLLLGTDRESIRVSKESFTELIKRYLRLHPEILLELNSAKAKGTTALPSGALRSIT